MSHTVRPDGTINMRGGKRPNAGRKAPDGKRINHSVKLNPREAAYIKQHYGSLTKMVRTIVG